ncbi:hypothetical protein QE152_g34208 [Popillia japonica]|uniref:Uncharacterized protein n=1 Tax=Popillia japonica TaxID=7064 RepID=A0AAW1IUS2_POPJA
MTRVADVYRKDANRPRSGRWTGGGFSSFCSGKSNMVALISENLHLPYPASDDEQRNKIECYIYNLHCFKVLKYEIFNPHSVNNENAVPSVTGRVRRRQQRYKRDADHQAADDAPAFASLPPLLICPVFCQPLK